MTVREREVAPLLSDEHFSVDGTLVKAWASMKSFQPMAAEAPPDEDRGPGDPAGGRRARCGAAWCSPSS